MAVVQVNTTASPPRWPPHRSPTPPSNTSFLYSQHRKNIDESKKNVLNLSMNTTQGSESTNKARPSFKKISFKVKKTASIYRRGGRMGSVGISSNVAQLASKFNQMNKGIVEENTKVGSL